MESSGEDTDIESQPVSSEDTHRLLYIIPDNEVACSAILELRDKLSVQSADDSLDHHRSFLRVTSDSYTRGGARDYTPTSGSGSDGEAVMLGPEETYEADGHFELSLLYQPARRAAGWTIGRGRTESSSAPLVDLLVPVPRSSGMHSYHCAFQFNDAGQLQVMAFHSRVSLDHFPIDAGTARVLHRPDHRLQVGPCLYRLAFAPQDHLRDAHQKAKKNYLQEHYPGYGVPHELISATPSRDDQYINDDWKISTGNAIGTGAGDRDTGMTFVQAASHTRENKVRALKERRRIDERGSKAIQFTERTYARLRRLLGDDGNREFIEHLDEILYSGSDRIWTPGVKDKVYHLFSPLGNGNFRQFFIRRTMGEVSKLDKTALFVQILMGMDSLQRARIIHRDIKPENLVVVLSNPPRAAIIDFGQAIFQDDEKRGGIVPTPGRGGTIGYLAPEQENPTYSSDGLFGCPIDVFALGLVGIDIFSDPNRPIWPMKARNPNPFREPLNRSHIAEFDGVLRYLAAYAPGSFFHLLGRMLDKSPATRIKTGEILVHPAVREHVQAQYVRREAEENSSFRLGSKRLGSSEFASSRFTTPTPGPS
ncbi:hypothetical protein AMS68_000113 [Peltaster fructicola]|uniref:non-specific serine/threonine protein kinase n=1 Tax=Peltaster fructicola TaxID=286661 RepID=A0A6H0XIQ0_9PEZI|nr:hypothetical protein AMS68_000113 [Peltaster fructicola]